MKKNLTFKIGLFCAALVLVATCFVTSAWAKYTQTVKATDSARVAKFVFMVEGSDSKTTQSHNIDLFKTNFENIKHDGSENFSGARLIAPGSYGSFELNVDWTGSEVSLEFDYSAVVTNAGSIPLKWSLDNSTWEDSLDAVLDDCYFTWDVNVASATTKAVTVYWKWDFNGDNTADTALGYLGTDTYNVTISVVATQIQATPKA